MKILLEVPDSKAAFMMEVLGHFSYVKTALVKEKEPQLVKDLKEAVEEMKLIKAGKKQAKDAEAFLDEL